MSGERVARATRHVHVSAPAGVVYAVLADAAKLPVYCSQVVHVERLESDGERERIRMWSLIGGHVQSWISWRHLDPVERRLEFRQKLRSPLDSVRGVLSVRPTGPRDTRLELRYGLDVEEVGGVDSHGQLAELKSFAERWTRLDDLMLTFEDSIRFKGPAELAYDFLYRAGDWPELVPNVARVGHTEESPGVQRLSVERLTGNGSHTTESVRICFPHAGRIVHKQTADLLLAAHLGEWSVSPDETGTTITSRQSVVLREENIPAVLGPGAGLADARRHVRTTLGRDSQVLLALARQHAQSAVRML
jgi:aromatase